MWGGCGRSAVAVCWWGGFLVFGRDGILCWAGRFLCWAGREVEAGDLGVLSLLLPPPGAYRCCPGLTQGVASLRSLALGWELIAPPGRADVAGGDREICVGRDGILCWAGGGYGRGMGAGMTGVQIKPRRGCKLTAQGKRAKRCDTLGLGGAKTMRPRRGQKQRRRGWCRGFCPLRGRYADAMRTLGALRKNMFSAGNQRRGKMRRVVRRSCCSTAGRGSW